MDKQTILDAIVIMIAIATIVRGIYGLWLTITNKNFRDSIVFFVLICYAIKTLIGTATPYF